MRNPFRRRPAEPEQRAITSLPWTSGGISGGGNNVSVERALGLVPVYAAARLLANSVASLPLHAYRGVGDSREQMSLPPVFSTPGVSGSPYQWKHRMMVSLALRGNAVGMILSRDRDEYPTLVDWLNPSHVNVVDSALSGPGSYQNPTWYWNGRIVPKENLIHIPWFTVPNQVWGLSPIGACAMAISTGLAAQEFSNDWFQNGAVPPGKFQNTQKTVSREEADEIKDRLVSSMRTRKPLVYGNDWAYDPITVSVHEAKFIETLRMSATQVATIYGIPPEMIGGDTGASMTYSTVEQNAINFVQFTLRPWLELCEDAFFDMMPKPRYVKFNADALMRTDLLGRLESYKLGRSIGLYNIDECRIKEDLPPLPDGMGQDYAPLGYPGSGIPHGGNATPVDLPLDADGNPILPPPPPGTSPAKPPPGTPAVPPPKTPPLPVVAAKSAPKKAPPAK